MTNQWFKFYGAEWLSDPKRDLLTPIEQNCFVTILCYAQLLNDDGKLKNVSSDTILLKSGVRFGTPEYENNSCVLKRFVELGMLIERRGVLVVKNWKKRQEVYSESRDRVKRWREKQEQESNVTVTLQRNGKNREEKKRIDKKRIEENKQSFGENKNVSLSIEDYNHLVDILNKQAVDQLIEELDGYIEATGKKYRSHRAVIQNWARRRIQDHAQKTKASAQPKRIVL